MPPEQIRRFSRTERALHWVHASAFFVLLASGLVLYTPRLSELVARRQLVKVVHLYTALAWAVLIALLLLLGPGRGLRTQAGYKKCRNNEQQVFFHKSIG